MEPPGSVATCWAEQCAHAEGLRKCSMCHVALYCCAACQSRDWPHHKSICAHSALDHAGQKLSLIESWFDENTPTAIDRALRMQGRLVELLRGHDQLRWKLGTELGRMGRMRMRAGAAGGASAAAHHAAALEALQESYPLHHALYGDELRSASIGLDLAHALCATGCRGASEALARRCLETARKGLIWDLKEGALRTEPVPEDMLYEGECLLLDLLAEAYDFQGAKVQGARMLAGVARSDAQRARVSMVLADVEYAIVVNQQLQQHAEAPLHALDIYIENPHRQQAVGKLYMQAVEDNKRSVAGLDMQSRGGPACVWAYQSSVLHAAAKLGLCGMFAEAELVLRDLLEVQRNLQRSGGSSDLAGTFTSIQNLRRDKACRDRLAAAQG